jgi:hypothetical protein
MAQVTFESRAEMVGQVIGWTLLRFLAGYGLLSLVIDLLW